MVTPGPNTSAEVIEVQAVARHRQAQRHFIC